jgi:hypothetical protein
LGKSLKKIPVVHDSFTPVQIAAKKYSHVNGQFFDQQAFFQTACFIFL